MTARLYLVTPVVEDPAGLARELDAMLGVADVAAVLIRLAAADERTLVRQVKALAPTVQKRGAALLLDGRPEIAVRAGADGAHLTGVEALAAALPLLKPNRIAGAGGLASRHDAMLAGQSADYVMFGEPVDGRRPAFDAILERVGWWAELFEPPCVGYAESLEEVAELSAAGADFVALGAFAFADGAAAVQAAAERLAPEPVA